MLPVLLWLACAPLPPPSAVPPPVVEVAPSVWPEAGAPLTPPVVEVPEGFRPQRVFVVAGHGAPGNSGNLGSTCVREQDFTRMAADRLARMLDATGQLDAILARTGGARPSYRARLAHLEASGAAAMIELHSDSRADSATAAGVAEDGEVCWSDHREPGFTVLVRDRGPAALVAERLSLARHLAIAMAQAGFPPWTGDNYEGLYEADAVPGVWRDRRRLFMLDRPTVPSVIIETHNARDLLESQRWQEARTHEVFGRAVLAGLLAHLDPTVAPAQ